MDIVPRSQMKDEADPGPFRERVVKPLGLRGEHVPLSPKKFRHSDRRPVRHVGQMPVVSVRARQVVGRESVFAFRYPRICEQDQFAHIAYPRLPVPRETWVGYTSS